MDKLFGCISCNILAYVTYSLEMLETRASHIFNVVGKSADVLNGYSSFQNCGVEMSKNYVLPSFS